MGSIEAIYSSKESNTIRIRKKGERLAIQIKIPEVKRNSLHVKKEYEGQVNMIPDRIPSVELNQLTEGEVDDDVFLLGSLETMRKECRSYDNALVCLDKNSYL